MDIDPLALNTSWPDWLPGVCYMPDKDHSAMKAPPAGIVVHSGSIAENVAEYCERTDTGRRVSYHFAWSSVANTLVQQVSMRRRAWHAGRAGNDWLGIALPGPWRQNPRSVYQRCTFNNIVKAICHVMPSVKYWCRHSEISTKRSDPGPGFDASWFDGCGVTHRLPS